jgi:hypothetical protein
MEEHIMVVLIILGGAVCLLATMLINDALAHKDYPVVISGLFPMAMLIIAIGVLMALIALS